MLPNLGTTEFIIIGVIASLFLGREKLSEFGKNLGKTSKELKKVKREYEKTVSGQKDDLEESKKKKPQKKLASHKKGGGS